ncbi:IPTL-CTERM sorting domain-containing protein [Paracidovorax konjaci]|uniref:IPTL-CTERM sorting domain-containing protein n=1 Tax=Paracidovorax konjaci TaxID=32040 RepID=UPI000B894B06|nr:IPTL-CTERM sorting domain-containing protein [Paracidovorax konjaci]
MLGRIARPLGIAIAAAWCLGSAHAAIISEFRLRGPSGASDEYIRILNETNAPVTVAASSGTGWAIAASNGVVRCTIPNGTVLPAGGSFLCTNSAAYSLGGGNPLAVADATYTGDIPDNAGIALFDNNTGGGSFTLANRLDAVGSSSESNTLYKEGTGYPALTPFSIDYAFVRDRCGKQGSITTNTPCTTPGVPLDTNNNATDFIFVDTNGTSAGAGQRLGAPGPANLTAPIAEASVFTHALLDGCSANTAPPNVARDLTSDPANNSTFGTLDIRRTFTNTSGLPITRLRFRVVDLTTFPAPSGFADLRPRTSSNVVVTVDRAPCGSGTSNVTVAGTTLDQPPSQPNGGGFNSTLTVPSVTSGAPLAPGASIDVRFLLGVQQTGFARFAVVAEGTPTGGGLFEFQSCTDGGACPPTVSSIVRAGTSPTNGSTVSYTVTFDQSVTGVDAADFSAVGAGGVTGASVNSVTGSGTTYTVVVNTGTGDGTVGLNLVDNDSIQSTGGARLGGTGAGNGNYTGEVYTIDKTGPTVTVEQAAGQADPVATGPLQFTVTFSEAVTGFTNAQVTLGGTAGATTATVTGGPTVYTVEVSGMTGPGTVIVSVTPGAVDSLGNQNAASTSVDNSVTFTGAGTGGPGGPGGPGVPGGPGGSVAAIPTLSEWGLMLLATLLGASAWAVERRRRTR